MIMTRHASNPVAPQYTSAHQPSGAIKPQRATTTTTTTSIRRTSPLPQRLLALLAATPTLALAQGFTKITTTVTSIQTLLVGISVAVVTIAIIWAGFKMIFQGARLSDVSNVLVGGAIIGGAAAIATMLAGAAAGE